MLDLSSLVPGQVTSLQVTPLATVIGLNITWGPSDNKNKYPPSYTYQLRYREGRDGSLSDPVSQPATNTTYTLQLPKPGTLYIIEIWIQSSIGRGQSSTRSATTYNGEHVYLIHCTEYVCMYV